MNFIENVIQRSKTNRREKFKAEEVIEEKLKDIFGEEYIVCFHLNNSKFPEVSVWLKGNEIDSSAEFKLYDNRFNITLAGEYSDEVQQIKGVLNEELLKVID